MLPNAAESFASHPYSFLLLCHNLYLYVVNQGFNLIHIKKVDTGSDSENETEEEIIRKTFTLKQLIRKLHITSPVDNVMCLIGKK